MCDVCKDAGIDLRDQRGRPLVELVALAARGAVRLTTTTNPLDGVDDALHALDGGRMIGRGVLAPDES